MDSYYTLNDNKLMSNEDLERIKKLRIPPKWESVKISKDPISKVQVTGVDVRGRTQYIYHPIWVLFSKESKYLKIDSMNFNKFFKIINDKCKFNNEISKDYVIANVFILMKDLNIRVGNEIYLKENDSIGLTTMLKNNYKQDKYFEFKGKKGIFHKKEITSKSSLDFLSKMKTISGKKLFKYEIDKKYKPLSSTDMNDFLKKYVDENMTCKDIRTYCANKIYNSKLEEFKKQNVKNPEREAIKYTAEQLGNTPKVCRDSYINLI